jgi:hypothetical protein
MKEDHFSVTDLIRAMQQEGHQDEFMVGTVSNWDWLIRAMMTVTLRMIVTVNPAVGVVDMSGLTLYFSRRPFVSGLSAMCVLGQVPCHSSNSFEQETTGSEYVLRKV